MLDNISTWFDRFFNWNELFFGGSVSFLSMPIEVIAIDFVLVILLLWIGIAIVSRNRSRG